MIEKKGTRAKGGGRGEGRKDNTVEGDRGVCGESGREEKPLTREGEKAAVHSPGDGLQFEQLHARPCSRRQAAQ